MPDEKIKVIVPSAHSLAQRTSVELKSLGEEAFVLLPVAAGLTLCYDILYSCRSVGFEHIQGYVPWQISFVVNLVAAEMGIS
ncbi:hypothetical protein K5Y32_21655 [Pantoea sp. DY-15]|uniref:LysR substrate-binding domain-containing protein n=1 Tax=Pantoea sp. DY-15 TaxID=2871489 RepID=UPI001C95D58C|nr:LysR substrate-binding domain-containing protein [Pantoea sp. DY-15]MBY4890547.1 hypothetical protein [Pantoea sp. DY-15]